MARTVKQWGQRSGLYVAIGLFTLFSALPFYVMLITTFKGRADIFSPAHNPFWFTDPPTLSNIDLLFFHTQFGQWLLNHAFVGVAVVVITMILAIPAAYSLARIAGGWGETLGIEIGRASCRERVWQYV